MVTQTIRCQRRTKTSAARHWIALGRELLNGKPLAVPLVLDNTASILDAVVVEGFATGKVTDDIAGELRLAGSVEKPKVLTVNDYYVETGPILGALRADLAHRVAAVPQHCVPGDYPSVVTHGFRVGKSRICPYPPSVAARRHPIV